VDPDVRQRATPAVERLERESDALPRFARLAGEEAGHRHLVAHQFDQPDCRGRLARSGPALEEQPERRRRHYRPQRS
jgi:hypothetical protein